MSDSANLKVVLKDEPSERRELKVSILGAEYDIKLVNPKDDPCLEDKDGYHDSSSHEIVVDIMDQYTVGMKKNIEEYRNSVLRHEMIHAFLSESGLDVCSNGAWAKNEEMVDWIAIQFPKMMVAFQEVWCI